MLVIKWQGFLCMHGTTNPVLAINRMLITDMYHRFVLGIITYAEHTSAGESIAREPGSTSTSVALLSISAHRIDITAVQGKGTFISIICRYQYECSGVREGGGRQAMNIVNSAMNWPSNILLYCEYWS